MYKRDIKKELLDLAKGYPVVTVTGPRQAGKSTLVQVAFPKKPYVNLEELDIQEAAKTDPRSFLKEFPKGAIIDEIQRVPELLSYIQVITDQADQKGMFILTGSHQLQLHQAITQSLAGRTALLHLYPLSLAELKQEEVSLSLDDYLLKGGYPRVYKDHLNPNKAYRNYFQTYIERDLRQILQVKDLMQFQKFVRMCAGRIGQLLNLESLGNDVGVSSHTVKEWISILEASFVLFRLPPYFENFGKRMVKSPKLYFVDVGLACYLLGIENIKQLSRDPLRGQLVENFVVMELIKHRANQGKDPQLYFFRDAHGNEVDLLFQTGRQLVPIEIKASETYTSSFLKNLLFFRNLLPSRCEKGALIYGGNREHKVNGFQVLPIVKACKAIDFS